MKDGKWHTGAMETGQASWRAARKSSQIKVKISCLRKFCILWRTQQIFFGKGRNTFTIKYAVSFFTGQSNNQPDILAFIQDISDSNPGRPNYKNIIWKRWKMKCRERRPEEYTSDSGKWNAKLTTGFSAGTVCGMVPHLCLSSITLLQAYFTAVFHSHINSNHNSYRQISHAHTLHFSSLAVTAVGKPQ
jgi:hypothetical protein